jgi:hypothetical protein
VQGIVTLVIAFFGLLGAIVMALAALGLLILMITLLVAVPFGTIAYFAAFADFPTGAATATLGLILILKIAFCILLILAHERFLQNKGIVILSAVSWARPAAGVPDRLPTRLPGQHHRRHRRADHRRRRRDLAAGPADRIAAGDDLGAPDRQGLDHRIDTVAAVSPHRSDRDRPPLDR